jgi:hypothetical protein
MKHIIPTLRFALLLLLLAVATVSANTYVSSAGRFYFTYPDDWEQIDYNTVDYYLMNGQADREAFNYDAAFAPKASVPFYAADYLIVSVDSMAALTPHQVDSMALEFSNVLGESVKRVNTGSYMAQAVANTPVLDTAENVLVIVSNVSDSGKVVQKNIWVQKFYKGGVANFYFYTPDSLYQNTKDLVETIVASFSTENIEAARPREQLKMANINTDNDEGTAGPGFYILVVAVILILAILALFVIKKVNRKRS